MPAAPWTAAISPSTYTWVIKGWFKSSEQGSQCHPTDVFRQGDTKKSVSSNHWSKPPLVPKMLLYWMQRKLLHTKAAVSLISFLTHPPAYISERRARRHWEDVQHGYCTHCSGNPLKWLCTLKCAQRSIEFLHKKHIKKKQKNKSCKIKPYQTTLRLGWKRETAFFMIRTWFLPQGILLAGRGGRGGSAPETVPLSNE